MFWSQQGSWGALPCPTAPWCWEEGDGETGSKALAGVAASVAAAPGAPRPAAGLRLAPCARWELPEPRARPRAGPGREPGTASERRSPSPSRAVGEFDRCWRRETAPVEGRRPTSSDAGSVLRAGFTGSEGGDGLQMCFFSNQTRFGKPPCGAPSPFGLRGPCGDRGV